MSPDSDELQAMVDEGRVKDVLALVGPQAIAETWIRYQNSDESTDRDKDWWAVQLWMSDAWWADEKRVRSELLRLLESADGRAMDVMAAGPLEVFADAWDESRLAWIETQCRRSEKFKQALASIWVWDLPDRVFRRLERAAGTKLADPDERRRARRLRET